MRKTDIFDADTQVEDQDGVIQIQRDSEEFREAAKALGDFMNELKLPASLHNRLVDLTVAQVNAAERNAFMQGVGLGLEYARYEAQEEND